jgi:hypothetical protein
MLQYRGCATLLARHVLRGALLQSTILLLVCTHRSTDHVDVRHSRIDESQLYSWLQMCRSVLAHSESPCPTAVAVLEQGSNEPCGGYEWTCCCAMMACSSLCEIPYLNVILETTCQNLGCYAACPKNGGVNFKWGKMAALYRWKAYHLC